MPVLWLWMVVCAWASMPVESVRYTVDVAGPVAEVTVEQVFVNDTDQPIDAVYVFPLHEQAAVDTMRMVVGERVIEGVVKERQAAEAEYAEAVDAGHTAALTTQERPNVFTQHVGNIGAGEEVRVLLRAIQPVPHLDGRYRLVLPLKVMPRFVEPEQLEATLTDLSLPPHERAFGGTHWGSGGLEAHLDIAVDAGLPFTHIESTSHDAWLTVNDTVATTILGQVPMDRDFTLQWSVAADRPEAAAWIQSNHAVLTLEPPQSPPREHIVARELIWVIDQSCSMRGPSIELARQAMRQALLHVDARDSLRILRFSNRVAGDAYAKPATPDTLRAARAQIDALEASGGTYLLDGVLAALGPDPDPERERYVMFLTDGGISNDRRVLAAIKDNVGSGRLFAFGVGRTSNRWLLDEMSRFGGGKTTWIREGESPEEAVDRFIDTIDKPVLTNIEVDWGDWRVEDSWPRRLPALYAGQPLMITTRVLQRGTTPIVVRGRLGDGLYERVLDPSFLEDGRALPSTWARQKIANLERDQVWGDVPELADDILATSLEYQVMSQYTAFLAVDRSRVHERPPAEEAPDEDWQEREGHRGPTEIVVEAAAAPIHSSSTSTSQVLTKDFLQKLPSGRSYQTAVGLSAGVTGGGGNRNIAGGATNANTYMLDGANITDPVTGTFSVNLSVDAVAQIEVLTAGTPAEFPGSGTVIDLVSETATNNLEWLSEVHQLGGPGVTSTTVGAQVGGPLKRDALWQLASIEGRRTVLGSREWIGGTALSKWTLQPTAEHRLNLTALTDPWSVRSPLVDAEHVGGLGQARWQWFLDPAVNLDTLVTAQHSDLSGDRRSRLQGHSKLALLDIRDPLGGNHDLKFGADGEYLAWVPGGPVSRALLGGSRPAAASAPRVGAFAQDRYQPVRRLTLDVGARLDAAFGRAHLGPRAALAWDPWGTDKTKLATGFGRYWGPMDLIGAAAPPVGTLVQRDEWRGVIERELVEDLALRLHGTLDQRRDVPLVGGGRIDQDELGLRGVLHKVRANRWEAELDWTWTRPLQDPQSTLYNDGATRAFAHQGRAWVWWDLPTDPWTLSVAATGLMVLDPLGTGTPISDPDVPHWGGGLKVQQNLDVRKGHLELDAEVQHVPELGDRRALDRLLQLNQPLPDQPGSGGLRVGGGVRYTF